MSKKHPDDFDLSLTGSQIGSARSAKSAAKRPSSVTSADGLVQRANVRGHQQLHVPQDVKDVHVFGNSERAAKAMYSSTRGSAVADGSLQGAGGGAAAVDSSRSRDSARSSSNRNLSDDFLAFFDGTAGGTKPRIKEKNERKVEHGRTASATAAAATAAAASTSGSASKKSNAAGSSSSSWYSHSVFRPDSSLSGSALDCSSTPGTPLSTAAATSAAGAAAATAPGASASSGAAAAAAAAVLSSSIMSPRLSSGDSDDDGGGLLNNELDPVMAAAAARVSRLLSQGGDSVIVNSTRGDGSGVVASGSAAQSLRASTAAQKALNAANNAVARLSSGANTSSSAGGPSGVHGGRSWADEARIAGSSGGGGRPSARLSLSDMENSYLNIMHKTPVNEIRSSAAAAAAAAAATAASAGPTAASAAAAAPAVATTTATRAAGSGSSSAARGTAPVAAVKRSLSVGSAAAAAYAGSSPASVSKDAAEQYIRNVNIAAARIQRWYRQCAREQKARRSAEAAMRRLLDEQKERLQKQPALRDPGSATAAPSSLEEDSRRRQQLREERARQARLHAIEELKLKRQKEKMEVRQKAEADVAQLKASGRLAVLTGAAGKSDATVSGSSRSKMRTTQGASASLGSKSSAREAPTSMEAAGADAGLTVNQAATTAAAAAEAPASSWADEWADHLGSAVTAAPSTAESTGNNNNGSGRQMQQLHQSSGGLQTSRTTAGAASAVSFVSSNAATRTTLNDLMSTLKLLEEEERLQPPEGSRRAAWGDDDNDADVDADVIGDSGGGLSEERLRRLDAATAEASAAARNGATPAGTTGERGSTNLTDAKMRNILSFLDEVDTTNRLEDIETEVEKVTVSFPLADLPSLTVPSASDMAQMEQASQAASEVANAVISQRLELDEKTRTVQMLQKALNQQRELTIRHAKETEKEMKKRLNVQKEEYEETIKRHLSFIDQLIDDKKALTEKCEQLVKDFKQMEKKYVDKIRALEESHSAELAKTKEVLAASEKLKREKWIEEKTKKIKEMTVKGLEPEIQRLISKHKSELKQLRSVHEAELLQADERAGQRYIEMTEQLRDQLAKEKDLACQREREAAAQRYEKQLQAEEEAYQQQRRRLYAEVQEEKERLAQQASRQRSEIDKLLRQGEDAHAYAAAAMRAEFEKARDEQERRHTAELQELKERQTAEREAWEQNVLKKQEAWLVQRERELKEQVRRERDKEIELVITRLEDDATSAREETERATENKIKRIRDKYESEMTELEKSERQAAEKYAEAKAKLVDVGAELERCRALLKQKDHEVDDVKKMSEKLYRERDQVQEVVRQEFADRLVATEEENRRLKQDMAELKSKHKIEIERMKLDVEVAQKSKEEEMEEVHKRVKQAIVKKEEVMAQLKQQYQAAVKRADHLEGLLEQQRKQLLGNTGGGKK